MIGIVTDSNAQLPDDLVARYGVEVVPLTVIVDGVPRLEGVELDADAFYALFEGGHRPQVSTSQPSPGLFADAYRRLADAGAREVLSIHIGTSVSGTLGSARLAAGDSPVPVRLVDTGTASFGVACCVWEAGEALLGGADVEEAATVAEQLAVTVGNVFTVAALDLARAGGRLAPDVEETAATPVLSLVGGEIRAVGTASTVDDAADVMADYATRAGGRLRIAVGVADAGAASLVTALEARLRGHPSVHDLVRYRIGPSVGAHTGPGTAGAFFYPVP
jgi:DegV family protein with EDD domain